MKDYDAQFSSLLGRAQALQARTDATERAILNAAIAREKVVREQLEQLRPVVLTQRGASGQYQRLTLELDRLARVIALAEKNLAHTNDVQQKDQTKTPSAQ